MKVSAIEALDEPFVLLGPGFSNGSWLLVRRLRPSEGERGVWFCDYARSGKHAMCLDGDAERIEVEFDRQPSSIAWTLDDDGYAEQIEQIRQAIAAGDVYQVNLTLRTELACSSGAILLGNMCHRAVPPYAAWWRVPGWGEGVSASPELLFAVRDRIIRAQPMKGTACADQSQGLNGSLKDAAELAMITDLVRDDLHRLCEPRSVIVNDPRRLIALPYATQTVAEIEGTLSPAITLRNALHQLHPAGSVTGAPRKAACAMIDTLERTSRGPYCGTLGWSDGHAAHFAVLIRTAWRTSPTSWRYGVGGGITWDSDAALELAEVHIKLGAFGGG